MTASKQLRTGSWIGAMLFAIASCRMDNPAFEAFDLDAPRACDEHGGDGCEPQEDASDGFGTETRGQGQADPSGSEDADTGSDHTPTSSSQAPGTAEPTQADSGTDSTGQDSTGQDSTSEAQDTLPEYALGCGAGMANCYTMKFDMQSQAFAPRGTGTIQLAHANANGAIRLRTGSSADQTHFRHSWFTEGEGYGLMSSQFSTASLRGVGIEVMFRGLSCPGTADCYFAGLDGILSIGYDPVSGSVVCRNSYQTQKLRHQISPGAQVRVGCSLDSTKMLMRVDREDDTELFPGHSIDQERTALVLGPSLVPIVPTSAGVTVEIGWVRIWNDTQLMDELTGD